MGEAKRRRQAGLEPRSSFRVRVAAIHESGHVLADLHWDVPILEVYVKRCGAADACGFTDSDWSLGPTKLMRYANQISQLAGPIADLQYRESMECDDEELEACVTSSYDDFRDIMGREGIPAEEGVRFGRACFLLYWGMESEVKIRDEKTLAFTKTLVADTTALVTAYATQITDFANTILAAPDMKLSQADVEHWRDRRFKKLSLEQPSAFLSQETPKMQNG